MSQRLAVADFVTNLFTLWDEILGIPEKTEGPAWVLDLGTGWAQSLAAVSAAEAPRTQQKGRFFGAAARVREPIGGNSDWQPLHLGGAMAAVSHLACHLGAVRQTLPVVKG